MNYRAVLHACVAVVLVLTCAFLPHQVDAQSGCAAVDAQEDLTVSCDEPCTELEAIPFEVGGTETYEVSSIPFDPPFPINAGTSLFIGVDDTWSSALPLPFSFCFFGNTYDNVIVGSNGIVTFDLADAGGYCPWAFTASIPSTNLPNDAIFAPYMDINPATCGSVRWTVLGEEPCRTFVINYDHVCLYSCSSTQTTSQILLYETTNVIEVFIEDKPACGGWNSGNACIGIQNIAGNVGYAPPGRNTGNWSASDEAWRFTPNGAPVYDLEWFEDGVSLGTGPTVEVCPTETTTYSVVANYSACDGSEIIVSDEVVVNVDGEIANQPNPSIDVYETPWCTGAGVQQLEIIEEGGTWDSSCGNCLASDGSFDPILAGSGQHTVSYTIEGVCGPVTDEVIIEVIEDAVATFDAPEVLCVSGAEVDLVPVDPGGTWSASCGGCIDPQTGVFSPSLAGIGIHSVTYAFTDPCGDTYNQEIQVEAQPDATFNLQATACTGDAAFVPGFSDAGGLWSATCGNCIDPVSGLFDPQVAGAGDHQVSYQFDGNCPDFFSSTISVTQTEDPAVSSVDPLCESGQPIQLTAESTGGSWSANCGGCVTPGGMFDPQNSGAGSYTVTYAVGGECPVQDSEIIEVTPQLSAAITAVDTLCTGNGPFMMNAIDPGGTWSAACGNCIDSDGEFDPSSSGAGTFQVTYSIPGECGDTQTQEVIVDASDDASIFDEAAFCVGWGEVQLDAAQAGGYWTAECDDCVDASTGIFNTATSGIGNFDVSYQFDGVCGASETIVFEVTANDDSSIDPVFGYCVDANSQQLMAATPGGTWSADCGNCISTSGIFEPGIAGAGVYTITYTLPGPCGTTSTEELEIFPLPVVDFAAEQVEGCAPFAAGFSTAENGVGSFQWSFGDGSFSSNSNSTSHIFEDPGCYDVSLTITSPQGCVNSALQSDAVCVFPNPNSAFIFSPVQPDTDNPIIELQELATGEISYEWDFAGVESSTEPLTSFNLLNSGSLTSHICLTVTDINDCQNTFCRDIQMIEKLRVYVPSAFTPDGDGVNEVFVPVVLGADFYEFTVFDRWGEILFESSQVGEPWLGEVSGGEHFAQPGVYLWHLKVVGQDLEGREYNGHVTLIR